MTTPLGRYLEAVRRGEGNARRALRTFWQDHNGPPLARVEVRTFDDDTAGWICKVPGCPRFAGPYGSLATATREAARHTRSKHRGGDAG